jgi:hypothetical protein
VTEDKIKGQIVDKASALVGMSFAFGSVIAPILGGTHDDNSNDHSAAVIITEVLDSSEESKKECCSKKKECCSKKTDDINVSVNVDQIETDSTGLSIVTLTTTKGNDTISNSKIEVLSSDLDIDSIVDAAKSLAN